MRAVVSGSTPILRDAVACWLETRLGWTCSILPGESDRVLEITGEAGSLRLALSSADDGAQLPAEVARWARARAVHEPRAAYGTARLTPREREVGALIAAGCSNEEICTALSIQAQSVRNLVSSLLKKTGCANRIQIALQWREAGR